MTPRAIAAADLPALGRLNDAHAAEVNAMAPAAFAALVAAAFAARVVDAPDGRPAGFCIALDQATPRQGPNHGWFQDRLAAFAYVDRVVVDEAWRGRGLARAMYAEVIGLARAAGLPVLACEVNLDPPNPASMRFHEAMGFAEAGIATDPRNGKRVRYLTLAL
jgi:predicted GNAT superfamily acetyltransferase